MYWVMASAWVVGLAAVPMAAWAGDSASPSGKQLYQRHCVECHGAKGQGDDDAGTTRFEGSHSLTDLVQIIDETMPEDDPEACQGTLARAVARYVHQAFYAPAQQSQLNSARIALSRLTVRQYENALADLLATFLGEARWGDERGLRASYYNSKNFDGKKRVLQRVDGRVLFDFQEQSPQEGKIGKEEFAIQWQGSVLADETGDYEFRVETENGMKLWVNDLREPIIDAWVASGGKRVQRATIRLLGGRAYPIRLDFFKFKSKTASIRLSWVPPHRSEEVIPSRSLCSDSVPSTYVVRSVFPADDSSAGYERGNTVSRAWEQAITGAALEVAKEVADNLNALAGTKDDAGDRAAKAKQFCRRFVERAFRRPLSDDQRKFYVDHFFAADEAPELSVKKSVLLALQSPRFLYLGMDNTQVDDYLVASRMSFGMWDSLPDAELLDAAKRGALHTVEQVEAQSRRMLEDPRARAKMRYFLHSWLNISHLEGITKDRDRFTQFDDAVSSSLRTSLDLFLDDVLWDDRADFRQLLLADYWLVNEPLARYYDLPVQPGEEFVKVELDPQRVAGVLTHPYLMARFAYHKTSSPIHRGVFVVRSLLGRFLKPPPIAVAPLDEGVDPTLTTRERVALQTREPTCQTCHSMINALGFSFEHYDADGRFRERERQKPIDASGSYRDLAGSKVAFNGVRELADFLASSRETHDCFTRQLFHSVAKQPVEAYGTDAMQQLQKSFAESDFNVRELLVAMVRMNALGTNKE